MGAYRSRQDAASTSLLYGVKWVDIDTCVGCMEA